MAKHWFSDLSGNLKYKKTQQFISSMKNSVGALYIVMYLNKPHRLILYIYYKDIILAHFEPAWSFWNVQNNPSYFGNLLINQLKNKIWKEQ